MLFLLFLFLGMKGGILKIYSHIQWILFLFWVWIGVSFLWSADRENAIQLIFPYSMIFPLFFFSFSEEFFDKVLKITDIVCMVFALSILLSLIKPDFIFQHFRFLLATPSTVLLEIKNGEYSGIVGEKAQAAFLMNIGFAVVFASCYAKKKVEVRDFLKLMMYILALLLTGKRTLCLIPVALCIFFVLTSNLKNKYMKLMGGGILAAVVFLLLINTVPEFQVFYNRLFHEGGNSEGDTLNGRGAFWEGCVLMWKQKPITGWGIGSFNQVYFDMKHYYFKGQPWSYDAHNMYFQLLGEIGSVGIGLFFLLIIQVILVVKKMFAKRQNMTQKYQMFFVFGIYLLGLFFIYGFTGNTMHSANLVCWFVLGILYLLFVQHQIKEKENEKN